VRGAREHGKPGRGLFDFAREHGVAPVVAGVGRFDRAAARVVQRPAEIEVVHFIPATAAARGRETAHDRAARVKPHEIQPLRALRDDTRQAVRVRQLA
jgi:hypothetical protein